MMIKIINSIFIFLLSTTFAIAQTASILPPGKTSFFDANGNPLVNGTITFYTPGTTTLKTTWQDSGQTTPNTNPVLLDAAGRALIYGSGTYQQVVRDRSNNIIWNVQTSSTSTGGGGGGGTGDGLPIGTVLAWGGIVAPTSYAFAYGQEFNRSSYSDLFSALTINQNITCTLGSATLTSVGDTSQLSAGSKIESTCLNSGATVVSTTSSTVVASSTAIVSATSTGRFFPWGNGDGNLTFNAPDLRGRVLAGRDNMGGISSSRITPTYYGSDPASLAAAGGSQSKTIITGNLPPYTPAGAVTNGAITSTATGGFIGGIATLSTVQGTGGGANVPINPANVLVSSAQATSTFAGTAQGGTSTPISVVQPSITVNYIVKTLSNGSSGGGSTISLTTSGTSGVSTLIGTILNIPQYQGALTITTTGSSGPAILVGNILNIPQYSGGGGGGGAAPVKQDLLAGVGFTAGSSTSITLSSTPTGKSSLLIYFDGVNQSDNTWSLSGSVVTFSAAIPANVQVVEAIAGLPSSGTSGISLTTTGSSGAATLVGTVLNVPQYSSGVTLPSATTSQLYGGSGVGGTAAVVSVGTGLSLSGSTLTATGGGGTPAGSNTQLQYNSSGAFGASSAATFDGTGINARIGSTTPNIGAFSNVGITGSITATGLTTGTPDSSICINSSNQLIKSTSGANCIGGGGGVNSANFTNAVTTCGADPTGATDSTTAINNCISTYSSVSLPQGTFKISGAGINTIQNMMLFGAGMGLTTITQSTASGCVFNLSGIANVSIQNMTLDRSVTATAGGNGFCAGAFTSVNNVILRDIYSTNQWIGLQLPSAFLSTLENVWSVLNFSDGLYFSVPNAGGAFQWQLSNVNAQLNNGWGIEIIAPASVSYVPAAAIVNLTTYANGLGGINLSSSSGSSINDIKILNLTSSGDCGNGVNFNTNGGEHNIISTGLIEGAGGGVVSGSPGSYVYKCGRSVVGASGPTIFAPMTGHCAYVQGNNGEVSIIGMQLRGCTQSGIATVGTLTSGIFSNNSISGNNCKYTAATTSCTPTSAGDSGIYLSGTLSSISIMGNSGVGGGTQVYGLTAINGSATTVTSVGNVFNGNATAGCGGASYSSITKAGNIGTGC